MKLRELMEESNRDKILLTALKNTENINTDASFAVYLIGQLLYYFNEINSQIVDKVMNKLIRISNNLNKEDKTTVMEALSYLKYTSIPKNISKKILKMFTTGIEDVKRETKEIRKKSTKLPKKELKLK